MSERSARCNCDPVISTKIKHYDTCISVLEERYRNGEINALPRDQNGRMLQTNPHLKALSEDNLYHLALGTGTHDLPKLFGDVKFVCMGGTAQRMLQFARRVSEELGIHTDGELVDLTAASHRYSMYKVGPVISVNHNIGTSSLNVVLQELLKMLQYAGAKDPIFIRIGTCGGLGVPPGTVVVSNKAFNGLFNNTYDLAVLGEMIHFPAILDQKLSEEISMMASAEDDFEILCGGTMAAEDFYQGQGRLDGPFCAYSEEDKMDFLRKLREKGVFNIEMEVTSFAAFTRMAGVKAADVCVTLIDRLHGDQVQTPKNTLLEWQERPMTVVIRYIKKYLEKIGRYPYDK